MDKYKKLINNSLIFTVGSLGSKFITFFMLPLYTYKLSTSEFGVTDLVQTTVSLLIPVVFLSIFEATLRFSLESKENPIDIFTNSLIIMILSTILILIVAFILTYLNIGNYILYISSILIFQGYQLFFSQFTKAIGNIKVFAFNGILLTFLTAFLNIIFLVIFDSGIDGFFISIILANMISNMYLINKIDIVKNFSVSCLKMSKVRELLEFSIPLVPNSIAWWTTNTISRYFIYFFINSAANGIFAVANKIPALLNIINSIFFQSWQLSAIEEYNKEGKNRFFSNVYNIYISILFMSTSAIILLLKPIMSILVSPEFFISWKYVPFLLITVIYSSLSSFLGQNYVAAKKTKKIFTTTMLGAFINLLLNIILIPILELNGAGISSAISFFIVWIYREYDSRKMVKLDVSSIFIFLNHINLLTQIIFLYYYDNFIVQLLFLFISVYINRQLIINVKTKLST